MTSKKHQGSAIPPTSAVLADENNNSAGDLNIVGIGASAGGLEALELFFHNMPTDSGMAFVLVSHLAPDHDSMLTEILQRTTVMPVTTVLDQVQVEANHLYVIPPNRDLGIFHGKLQLRRCK